jgi:hypothetical protein
VLIIIVGVDCVRGVVGLQNERLDEVLPFVVQHKPRRGLFSGAPNN